MSLLILERQKIYKNIVSEGSDSFFHYENRISVDYSISHRHMLLVLIGLIVLLFGVVNLTRVSNSWRNFRIFSYVESNNYLIYNSLILYQMIMYPQKCHSHRFRFYSSQGLSFLGAQIYLNDKHKLCIISPPFSVIWCNFDS